MMATGVNSENFAYASIIGEPEQTTTTTTTPTPTPATTIQDDANDAPRVNGESGIDGFKLDTEPGDSVFTSAEVSVNGGSDSEAAKTETSKNQADEKGHGRSASTVKRLISFKAVSVNKTFLAAKGATGMTPIKSGDKGAVSLASLPAAPLTSSAPRPRLVAKSGSGLRDSAPRSSDTANGGKAPAPDANAVWNKNRPAPPPEQKRITDEELKQQYGIHLAERLQSDDPSRQANWADIDDDDDDWAPESIEWTDGTKITLPQADEVVPIPAKSAPPSSIKDFLTSETSKPASPAPQTSTSSALRLGGISSGPGKGLILKGATEKPTLVAKPPGPPTPVKSPWAPLPPVEKVAPISVDQQSNQSQSHRFSQRDPHSFENMPPPPAKEIAADDFSRSWREGNAGSNRELYNSQSGRYEPVNDGRRGSARADIQSRQPALLHRPSNQDQQGPAEPSAAFQTHRATIQDSSYSRRRTSSNVSGGSGNFSRRMSKGQEMRPHELFNARRGSLVTASDSPSSPRNHSPSGHQMAHRGPSQQPWQPRASPAMSHASPASAHGQMAATESTQPGTPVIPLESEIELQKRIMRESRELARKRRLEEEAREEAERKERIRLKLEAMGPPPESKKNRKDIPKEEKAAPTHIHARDITSMPISPPKPPVPESVGEIKQYGLMKVHHPDSVSNLAAESKVANTEETRSITQDMRPNGINSNGVSAESTEATATSQQGWQNPASSGPDRYSSWSSQASHTAQGRNVWGPPTNDRTLGNGTFNPELSRLPEIHSSQSSQVSGTGPGPIGPPSSNRVNGQYPVRGREQYGQRPTPIAPPHRQQGLTRLDQQQRSQATAAWNALPEKLAQEDARAREEQDKLDASRRELEAAGVEIKTHGPVFKDTWRQVTLGEDGARSAVKVVSKTTTDGTPAIGPLAWKNYPAQLAQEEAAEHVKLEQQDAARRQLEASGTKIETAQPVYKDTWRQVQLDSNGVRSEVLSTTVSVHNSSSSASPSIRGSRFFPQSRDVRLEDPAMSFTRPGSPSPPPPTMAGHPAYDGDTAHPHVSLPRPPPVVKLPPPKVLAPIGPPKPVASFAAAAAAPVVSTASQPSISPYQQRQHDATSRYRNVDLGAARPHGATGVADWQDRINHLIGRKSSPPKTHVLAVDSSSKNALELPTCQMSATVSLPTSASGNSSDDDNLFETKPMAEECFEEQEMGSLPAIRVPNKAPEAAWQLAPTQNKPLPRKFAVIEVTSADPLTFPPQMTSNGSIIHIKILGMPNEKLANIPHKMEPRQKSNTRRQGQSRGGPPRHTSSSHPRGGRPRDTSSGFPSPNQDAASVSSSANSTSRAGPRGRGGFGSHWSNHRHVSTANSAINV